MTTKTKLQNKIQELEAELVELKSQLSSYENTIENASVGDVLEDGSIVVKKENGLALLVAPKSTEVECFWSKDFPKVFQQLEEHGFNPTQWFVPTEEQLELAYQNIPNEFCIDCHRSSMAVATRVSIVGYSGGNVPNGVKTHMLCVRAFRCVTY
jgi:hypothetical protein